MSDYTLQPANTLIVGMTGSGKSTLAIRYLLNAPAACRFIFDWNDRITPRLHGLPAPDSDFIIRAAYTQRELEEAIPSRWVIFNPKRAFPGAAFDKKVGRDAMKFFAKFTREKCKLGPGKKFFACAELWNFCTEDSIPTELAMLAQDGRQDEVELVLDTQQPELLNAALVSASTEVICFRLDESAALRTMAKLRMNPDELQNLPLGQFVARNRLNGEELRGRLW